MHVCVKALVGSSHVKIETGHNHLSYFCFSEQLRVYTVTPLNAQAAALT